MDGETSSKWVDEKTGVAGAKGERGDGVGKGECEEDEREDDDEEDNDEEDNEGKT